MPVSLEHQCKEAAEVRSEEKTSETVLLAKMGSLSIQIGASFLLLLLFVVVFAVVLGIDSGLVLARQVLYHLNHVPSPFGFS
jgi:hypothetical protein